VASAPVEGVTTALKAASLEKPEETFPASVNKVLTLDTPVGKASCQLMKSKLLAV
jgi:hypothetical protein